MFEAGERAYLYGKACGIIGKSFLGKRVAPLRNINNLAELDRLLFPKATHDLPERELLPNIEKRILEHGVKQIISIIECFQKPPELLRLLIRSYEYADLKNTLAALANKETKPPSFTNIGGFRTVQFEAYPDLDAMVKGTEFVFLTKEKDLQDTLAVQARLDQHYYTRLWEAFSHLPKQEQRNIGKVLEEEIRLKNIARVLRLRAYYQLSSEKIKTMLISIKGEKSLTADALKALHFGLDNRADWIGWRWAKFVNTENSERAASSFWKIDPRSFQNRAAQYLYQRTYYAFRSHPFSLNTAFCFIKLKQFEEDLLTSIGEGFGFGLPCNETLGLLGVTV
jgi:vacuolar-type H+-ATPase subunit C/Vma6